MNNSVYQINKGINRSIEFKGFQAQYIWYLGVGLLILLFLFVVLYIAGIHPFFCLGIILSAGIALFYYLSKLSNKYGQYGLLKKLAAKKLPYSIKSYSRNIFLKQTSLPTSVNHGKQS